MTQPQDPTEEPQEERGAPGSRDEGGPPGSGPADRPSGRVDAGDDSDTTVDPQEPIDPASPDLQSGP